MTATGHRPTAASSTAAAVVPVADPNGKPARFVERLCKGAINEFTPSRAKFVDARQRLAAIQPRTMEDIRAAASDRFADGIRNVTFAATLVAKIKLPPDYLSAKAAAPSCAA